MDASDKRYPDRIYRNLVLFSSTISACLGTGAEAIGEEALTEAQLNALRFLYLKRDLVMRDVAEGLGFSFAAGTKTIDRLAKKGLAERVPGKGDGRQIHVRLTERGERLAACLKETTESAFERILAEMKEEDVQVLNRTLEAFMRGFLSQETDALRLCVACGFEDGLDCRTRGGDCLVKEAMSAIEGAAPVSGETRAAL